LAIIGSCAFFYYAFNFDAIIGRAARINPTDVYIGLVGMIFLAELCRRVVGLPIVIVAGAFVTYAFIDGYSLRRVVHQLFYTTEGIIGIPIGVASTFIVLFIFLASFLEKSGIAKFFIDLANSVAGSSSGGPAKVAVIASALLAIITGSSVANTVASGSVTIPAMKKTGYKPEFAAAVEAASSTGGQVMPPILGAAAFIMAEITGIPYLTIAVAAIIPALFYFVGVFIMVHLEAKKMGLKGLPKDTLPKFGRLILNSGYLLLPIVVLIVLLSRGFTPAYAACGAIISVFIITFFKKETRFTPASFIDAVATGSKNTLGVGVACAIAGTVVGIVTLTGIGQMLIRLLVIVVNNPFLVSINASLFAALVITAIACLILGLGVPTTAKYVIMATITAPMILRAGTEIGIVVPLLAAHMFVFHFGTDADITPPVGLAAYAGAAIAKSNPILTCVISAKLAIAGYILPFFFVFSPEMLFQVWDAELQTYVFGANPLIMTKIIISCFIGMFNISVAIQGWLIQKVTWPWRLTSAVAGFLLINPGLITTLIGLGITGLVIFIHVMQHKRDKLKIGTTSSIICGV
jgi:TRAP transporter 4TM/12TM fusion protein